MTQNETKDVRNTAHWDATEQMLIRDGKRKEAEQRREKRLALQLRQPTVEPLTKDVKTEEPYDPTDLSPPENWPRR